MSYLRTHAGVVVQLAGQHLALVSVALLIALLFALPSALLVVRRPALRGPLLGLLGAIYTIPSLALFALLIPLQGLGFWTGVTGLAAYAQLILVRNIVAGLSGVDRAVVEAAHAMGLTPRQILWRIETPLAMPVALAGIRLAAVSLIGIATIASLIDAGGLGTLIFAGLGQYNLPKALAGAIAAMLLAVAAELALRALEQRYRRPFLVSGKRAGSS